MSIIDLNVPCFSNKWINSPFYWSIWKQSEFKWWVYPLDNWIWRKTASSPKIQGHNNIPSLSVPSIICKKKKWRTSTGTEVFSLLVCLDASKFVLLCLYTYAFRDDSPPTPPRTCAKPLPKNTKRALPVDLRPSKTFVKTGQDQTKRDETRWDKTGQDRTRQDRTGQDRTRQDRTGQDKIGQDRTVKDKKRQDRTEHGKTERDDMRQDKTGQEETRQDETRQTRQDKKRQNSRQENTRRLQGETRKVKDKTNLISYPELLLTKPKARSGLVKSDLYTWSAVRNVTGDERAHAPNKSSKSRPFFAVLNSKFDRAVKCFLTKRGYTHILQRLSLTRVLKWFSASSC